MTDEKEAPVRVGVSSGDSSEIFLRLGRGKVWLSCSTAGGTKVPWRYAFDKGRGLNSAWRFASRSAMEAY